MRKLQFATLAAIFVATTSTVAVASPPVGKFSKLYPNSPRYSVTLVAVPRVNDVCIPDSKMFVTEDEDGVVGSKAFVVPDNATFVATDVHFRLSFGATLPPDASAWSNFFSDPTSGGVHRTTVWAQQLRGARALADHAFTTGVTFDSGARLCTNGAFAAPPAYALPLDSEVIVHGYVIDYANL